LYKTLPFEDFISYLETIFSFGFSTISLLTSRKVGGGVGGSPINEKFVANIVVGKSIINTLANKLE
jgi:hypothetical protein